MSDENIILGKRGMAYLRGSKAAITWGKNTELRDDRDLDPIPMPYKYKGKELRGVARWGDDNDFPQNVITYLEKSPMMTSNLTFNIMMGYGEGVVPCRIEVDEKTGIKRSIPVYDNVEINQFFDDNNIQHYFLEVLNDLNYFYNTCTEFIMNPGGQKIVSMRHKEMAFSRWEVMNPNTGKIEHHFYSAKWNESDNSVPGQDDIQVSDVLDGSAPLVDLKRRIGRSPNDKGVKKDTGERRWIVPIYFPTPGRFYYQRSPWYTLIESGWYDFAVKVPEFKKYLMQNQMTIKYHVQLSEDYFDKIFADEGIESDKDKITRIKQEYDDINSFLTNAKNTGKSVISFIRYTHDGKELPRIKIDPIDSKMAGGEYLDDIEEASNIMSYAMGVHPSIIGAAPGKNKAINGTEARELFNIKQALLKPIRDMLLRPLYIVKDINGWDKNIHFMVPNLIITTLDKDPSGITVKAL